MLNVDARLFKSARSSQHSAFHSDFLDACVSTPVLCGEIEKSLSGITPVELTRLFISETLIGTLIGFLARIFFSALETFGVAIAMFIGLSSVLAGPLEENEPLPAITSLITFAATALIFFTNLHWEILRWTRRFLIRTASIWSIRCAI